MKFLLQLAAAYTLLFVLLDLLTQWYPMRPGKLAISAWAWGGAVVVCEDTPLEGKKQYPCRMVSKEEYTKWLAGELYLKSGK